MMPLTKTPKLIERIHRSGYAPAVYNFGWFAVAAAAGVLQAMVGKPWWAGFNFFCAGIALGTGVCLLAIPMRRRELSTMEIAQVEQAAREALNKAVEEAIERGTLPPAARGNLFRMN